MKRTEQSDLLVFEREWCAEHPNGILVGIDEAGRGCLAGPVVAGAVSIPLSQLSGLAQGLLKGLTDSKQLTALQRDHFFEILTTTPGVLYATGSCTSQEIDQMNILAATHLAMRRAVESLSSLPDHALVDGLPVRGLPVSSTAIVKGDGKSLLIAAASVLAKVTRDRYMIRLHEEFPQYHFDRNKGYGAHDHIQALYHYGSCPEHRHTFRPVADVENALPGLW